MAMAVGQQYPGANAKFPPGFRFNPLDEELILNYLKPKLANIPLPYEIFNDVNLYEHHPAELVETYKCCGESSWYFFTPRKRKYPRGRRPNRMTIDGFWKATGVDKQIIVEGKQIGVRKALVFYVGKPGNGRKTDWIMHEYLYADATELPLKSQDTEPPPTSGEIMKLNDWVLCKIQKKRGADDSQCKKPQMKVPRVTTSAPDVLYKAPQPQQGDEGPMPLSFPTLGRRPSPYTMTDSNEILRRPPPLPQGNEGLTPNHEIFNHTGLFQSNANCNNGDMTDAGYYANDPRFQDCHLNSSSESSNVLYQSDLLQSNVKFELQRLPMPMSVPAYPSSTMVQNYNPEPPMMVHDCNSEPSMIVQNYNSEPPVNGCVYDQHMRTVGFDSLTVPRNSIDYGTDYFSDKLPASVVPSTSYDGYLMEPEIYNDYFSGNLPASVIPSTSYDVNLMGPEIYIDYEDDYFCSEFPASVLPSTDHPFQDYYSSDSFNGSDVPHGTIEDDKRLPDTFEEKPKHDSV